MWCFHIPQNCEILPKCQIFLKSPSRFSSIEDRKTSNLYRSIELDELVRIVMTWFDLNDWIPSERANLRSSAELSFSWRRCFLFEKKLKIAMAGPFSEEYSITKETGEKCLLHILFSLCCFSFICQRRGSERPPSFNLLFDHFCRYFSVLENMKASHWSRNQSIRTSSSCSNGLDSFDIFLPSMGEFWCGFRRNLRF